MPVLELTRIGEGDGARLFLDFHPENHVSDTARKVFEESVPRELEIEFFEGWNDLRPNDVVAYFFRERGRTKFGGLWLAVDTPEPPPTQPPLQLVSKVSTIFGISVLPEDEPGLCKMVDILFAGREGTLRLWPEGDGDDFASAGHASH
jgi:hypothetical protein